MEINEPSQTKISSNAFSNNNFEDTTEVNPSKNDILAQNADQYAEKADRRFKLRWILAISCLPLFGIYAAFGIAPQTLVGSIPTAMVVEEVMLPITDNVATTASNFWYKEHVRNDDTLNSVLSRLNIRNRDDIDFIRNDAVASEIASALKPGHEIESETDADGNLISL